MKSPISKSRSSHYERFDDVQLTNDVFFTWHRNVPPFTPALPEGKSVPSNHEAKNENATDERDVESKADSPHEEISFCWQRNNKAKSSAGTSKSENTQVEIKMDQRNLSPKPRSSKPKHLKVYQASGRKSVRRRGQERSPQRSKETKRKATNQQKQQEVDITWSRKPRTVEEKKISSSSRVDVGAIGEIARRLENHNRYSKYQEDKKEIAGKIRGRRYRSSTAGQKSVGKPRSMSPSRGAITRAAIEKSGGKQVRKSLETIRSFQANQSKRKGEGDLSRHRRSSLRSRSSRLSPRRHSSPGSRSPTQGQLQRRRRNLSSNESGREVSPSRRKESRSKRERQPSPAASNHSPNEHRSPTSRSRRSGRTRGKFSSSNRSSSPSIHQPESKEESDRALTTSEYVAQQSPTRSNSLPISGLPVAIPESKTTYYRRQSPQKKKVSFEGLSASSIPDSSEMGDKAYEEILDSQQNQSGNMCGTPGPQFAEVPEEETSTSLKEQPSAKHATDQLNEESDKPEIRWQRNRSPIQFGKSVRPSRTTSKITWHRKSPSTQ